MKKIHLRLFLIIVLIFMFMCPLRCFCQKQEKLNWGELWLEMDSTEKDILFIGVREGILYFVLDILSDDSTSGLSDLSNVKKELFSDYILKKYFDFHKNIEVLSDIITTLYKYPENSYIKLPYMIDIAIKKLKGEPIEKILEKRRKEAYENNSTN